MSHFHDSLKELRHGLPNLKILALIFQVCRFSILNHACSFMAYYYLFVSFYFKFSLNLKVVLNVTKITLSAMTELFQCKTLKCLTVCLNLFSSQRFAEYNGDRDQGDLPE